MASQASFVEFILDQLSTCEGILTKKMFGEYAVYSGEKMFALICDDQLFIKPTVEGRNLLEASSALSEAPPYPQAKLWFLIDSDILDDRDRLTALATITISALPVPVKKPKKTKSKT
ncbi:TfoX/Sxy family protein [Undibacterium sp. Ji49W]|uniref:TfoX/Sxy family protein n=1 Tax=Undibacterium sp. Ji49W TaxID=3413040 RepID=UPI003BF27CFB